MKAIHRIGDKEYEAHLATIMPALSGIDIVFAKGGAINNIYRTKLFTEINLADLILLL